MEVFDSAWTGCPCAYDVGFMGGRSLNELMFWILPLQTEDDSHPPFYLFDHASRQTADLMRE